MEKESEKWKKKRKFLMVLPLITLPFLTMAFWALGGGKGNAMASNQTQQGINKELPGAQFGEESLDKMSLYGKAGQDTSEGNGRDTSLMAFGHDSTAYPGFGSAYGQFGQGDYGNPYQQGDPNEQRVRQRLDELQRIMSMQNDMEKNYMPQGYGYNTAGENDASLGRLEKMMDHMSGGSEPDPELQVLDNMLEKIIDIQNPERAKDKIREQSIENRGVVFAVNRLPRNNVVPYLQGQKGNEQNGGDRSIETGTDVLGHKENAVTEKNEGNSFYDIDRPVADGQTEVSAIPAVIHETQTLVSGANLKMRLTEDIYVNGVLIPSGSFLSGECTLNGERLQVKISGIRHGHFLLPVSLAVFDLDGIEGIRIPGTITRDVAKDGADRALQSMQFMSLDPSIGTQAAGAGIEAAKSLISRKVRLIKVTVKAGHPILLYDGQSNKH